MRLRKIILSLLLTLTLTPTVVSFAKKKKAKTRASTASSGLKKKDMAYYKRLYDDAMSSAKGKSAGGLVIQSVEGQPAKVSAR